MGVSTEVPTLSVTLTFGEVCACGHDGCQAPACRECGFTFEEMIPLVDKPSIRVCGCGRARRVVICDVAEEIAYRRRHGIGPDCSSCIGTGIGRTSDHLCGRCGGRGFLWLDEEE